MGGDVSDRHTASLFRAEYGLLPFWSNISLLNGRLEYPCHLREGNSLTKKSADRGTPANTRQLCKPAAMVNVWHISQPGRPQCQGNAIPALVNRGRDNKTVSICAELHSAQPPPKMVAQRQDVRFADTVVQWQGGYHGRTAQPGRG